MQEQAHSTHDGQSGGRKRLAARKSPDAVDRKRLATRNSDANGRYCADSVCECRSKRPALPTMCNLSAGTVWPPGIRIPTVEIALLRCQAAGSVWPPGDRMPTVEIELILCVNAGKRPAPTMCSPAAGDRTWRDYTLCECMEMESCLL